MKGNSPLFDNYDTLLRSNSEQSSPKSGNSLVLNNLEIKNGPLKKTKHPIFGKNGHVAIDDIRSRREFFLGKSVARIEHEFTKRGYKVIRRKSVRFGSRAKIIVTINPSQERNVTQVQISSGSHRHGNIPYVKISTTDYGRIKIIG